jgi:hypothetical protein
MPAAGKMLSGGFFLRAGGVAHKPATIAPNDEACSLQAIDFFRRARNFAKQIVVTGAARYLGIGSLGRGGQNNRITAPPT